MSHMTCHVYIYIIILKYMKTNQVTFHEFSITHLLFIPQNVYDYAKWM